MKVLVISDLHIDTQDNIGTFHWDQHEMIGHIEKMRGKYGLDKVIFNGDTFELLKYSQEEINSANKRLIEYFDNDDFVFINGNHDMFYEEGLEFYQITNSSGQIIHIEHGHNADWYNGSRLGRRLSKIGFSLLKRFSGAAVLRRTYFRIVSFKESLNRVPKKYNTLKYLTYSMKLLKDYDVVVLGHTHKLEAHHTYYLHKKKRYLNCGSCSLGRFQGIVIDTETLKYDFIRETRDTLEKLYAVPMVS